jgi:hypothetical protein
MPHKATRLSSTLKQEQATPAKPANTAKNQSSLAPGGAAVIQNAQGSDQKRELFLVGGGILAASLILLLAAGGGGSSSSTSTH